MTWGEYDDGLTNPSLRWTEHPYDLSMQATEILLADRKSRVGHKHENTWLSPQQMQRRHYREVPASATVLEDGDLWIESFAFIPHFARPSDPNDRLKEFGPVPKRSITKADLGYSGDWRRPYKAFCVYGGCERPRFQLDLCMMHYQRAKKRGEMGGLDSERIPRPEVCAVSDCDRTDIRAKEMCSLHYRRWIVRGKPPVHTLAGPRRQRGKGVSASV